MVLPTIGLPLTQCSWGQCYAAKGLKGNQNQPVGGTRNVPIGSECCDRLLTKLPNNPLINSTTTLVLSHLEFLSFSPWALRALRGKPFVRWCWGYSTVCLWSKETLKNYFLASSKRLVMILRRSSANRATNPIGELETATSLPPSFNQLQPRPER